MPRLAHDLADLARRFARAWARFEDTAWADALGAAALFALLIAGLFVVLGFGGWGPLG